MTALTDIAALKTRISALLTRWTAIEKKDTAQGGQRIALRSEVDVLKTQVAALLVEPPPPPPEPPPETPIVISVTAPVGDVTWQSGTTQALSWTISPAASVGEFAAYLIDEANKKSWYSLGYYNVVAGQSTYTTSFSMSGIPAGAYKFTVWYRDDPGHIFDVDVLGTGVITMTAAQVPNPPPPPEPPPPLPPSPPPPLPPPPSPPPAGVFNVKDYGAKGDGSTDDLAAILAAIAAAKGATVYLPMGTYRLSKTLVVPPGTHLVGEEVK